MRIQHWLAPVLSLLLLMVGSRDSLAQIPVSPVYTSADGSTAANGYVPVGSFDGGSYQIGQPPLAISEQPGYMANTPSRYAKSPGGSPPSYGAWPNEYGPYQHGISQVRNEDGLWMRETIDGRRSFFFSLEALWGESKGPGKRVLGNSGVAGNPMKDLFFPPPTQATDPLATEGNKLYDMLSLQRGIDEVNANGIRSSIGFWNPDQSGVVLEGFWMPDGTERWEQGNLKPMNLIADLDGILLFPEENDDLRPWLAIPIANETEFGLGDSSALRFDKYVRVEYSTESGGASLSFVRTPSFKIGPITVRSQYGARYLHVHERLSFMGVRSNIYIEAWEQFVGNQQGGGGGGGQQQGAPPDILPGEWFRDFTTGDFTQAFPTTYTRYAVDVKSQMGGPEVGLRYDMGGENLLVWGQTKFGLLANYEKIGLTTSNIGDEGGILDADPMTFLPSDFSGQTAFYEREDHTHVSPLIEQSVFAEAKIFRHVPFLNKLKSLEHAKARVGFTYLWAASVSRPEDSYVLRTVGDDPDNPNQSYVSPGRGTWWQKNWSFAVDWEY